MTPTATLRLLLACAFLASASIADAYDYCQAEIPTTELPAPADAKLLHVSVVVRHGDRSATKSRILNDTATWDCSNMEMPLSVNGGPGVVKRITVAPDTPFKSLLWNGTCYPGQLTSKGYAQQHSLGLALRKLYVNKLHFLPKKLTSTAIISSRATDIERTQHSAIGLLAGLYPAEHRGASAAQIPLNVLPVDIDTMLDRSERCPKLSQLTDDMFKEPQFKAYWAKNASTLAESLVAKTGMDRVLVFSPTRPTVVPLMDALRTRHCHDMPLPCSVDDVTAVGSAVDEEYTLLRRSLPQSASVNRLMQGPFLGEFLRGITSSVANLQTLPLFRHYSGHDDTVFGMLANLGADEVRWPPYASSFIVEVWQPSQSHDNAPMVRIIFNGAPLKTAWHDFTKSPLVSLKKFISVASARVPEDVVAECRI